MIVGNPKLDLARYLKNSNITFKKKTIGVATRFQVLNNHIGKPLIFSLATPGKYSFTDVQIKSFITLINIIKSIIEKTDFDISIRVHPFESVKGYQENLERWFGKNNLHRFQVDESLDFSEWVVKQKVVITPTTTALTECYLLGVPIINIDKIAEVVDYNKNSDKVVDDWFNGAYIPSTISECLKLLKKNLKVKKSNVIDEMLKNYCNWQNNEYVSKISSDFILEELNRSKLKSNNFFFPLFIVREFISQLDRYRVFKNPLYKNFNYLSYLHKTPMIYKKIKEHIYKD